MTPTDEPLASRRAAISYLEGLALAGVSSVKRTAAGTAGTPPNLAIEGEPMAARPVKHGTQPETKPPSPAPPDVARGSKRRRPPEGGLFEAGGGPTVALADRPAALDVLRQEVTQCARCPELVQNRTQTVFGVGSSEARLCFVGEAPGADEDRQGEPFVGRAGQLLNRIIEASRLRREDVYILNVVKCRPPGNRTPLPDEAANCRGFLDRQLDILRPEFICCLGLVAAQALLATKSSMGRLRGTLHEYRGSVVVCTYHPAYLLRNPAAKKQTWEDMKLLLREMGVDL